MEANSKIIITGASGLLGSAIEALLKKKGFSNVLSLNSKICDLIDPQQTFKLFEQFQPEYVFHCAAFVNGIMGNINNQAKGIYYNTLINSNVIEASHRAGVKKITAISTGAIYPYPPIKFPLDEENIWNGIPHYSEYGYAHAKRHMLATLEAYNASFGLDYSYIISCNLFGPRDKFDTQNGHVIPSLIKKFYEAETGNKKVTVWGNGSAKRDFLFVDDAAEAVILIANNLNGPVNIGSNQISSIQEVVNYLDNITNKNLEIIWDETKPNGQDIRYYNLDKLLNLGFKSEYSLEEGLKITYHWYQNNHLEARHI